MTLWVWLSLAVCPAAFVVLVVTEGRRSRRKRRALLEIFGEEQLEGLSFMTLPLAYRAGLIKPIVSVEEMNRILGELNDA
jgi:bacteriorhodopsin